jgi:hypothetical protein
VALDYRGHLRPGETVLILDEPRQHRAGLADQARANHRDLVLTSHLALEAFADVYRTELRAWAPSSSGMVDAAWRAVWRVRRRPTVSDQSMWRVYS